MAALRLLLSVLRCIFVAPLLLTVSTTAAPTISKFPTAQTIMAGQTASFTVEATGTGPLTYQWYKGAAAISGATSATYTLPNAQQADAGIYSVAVTDSTGTTRTFVAYSNTFSSGSGHTLVVKDDGSLWGAGSNSYGQLGDNAPISSRPTFIPISTGVTAAATGPQHSLFLKSNGTLWAMGNNLNGQLGDGTTSSRLVPVQIATDVAAIATGTSHSVFLKTDGTAWAMGNNSYGQLGDGTTTTRLSPVQIASGVTAIAAAGRQTFYIKSDRTLWSTGDNTSGQVGGTVGGFRFVPAQIATDVSAISAGSSHTLFLKTDGTAWGFGANSSLQLGFANTTSSTHPLPVQLLTGISAISAGGAHSLFLKSDGTLLGCGYNYFGQAGATNTYSVATPTAFATQVTAISAGDTQSFYRRSDGTLWAMGYNANGQMGDGSFNSRVVPSMVFTPVDTPATLVIALPPAIPNQANTLNVTAGTPVSLNVEVTGTSPFTYQWSKDGVAVAGATSSSLTFLNTTIANVGTYTVTVTNAVGTATSQPITINLVLPLTASQTGVVGRTIGLQATTGGTGSLSWQVSTDSGQTWTTLSEGTSYSGVTTSLLRILNATAQTTNHLYRYVVTDGSRTVASAPSTVTMFTTPLGLPSGILLDKTGHLLVTDAAAAAVFKITPDLKYSVVAGKAGSAGSADGPGPDARFNEPTGFILSDDGSLTLTDSSNHTIRTVSPTGSVATMAGKSGTPGSADGDNLSATFNVPSAIAADITGTLVFADQMNHTIRTSTGGKVYTLAGRAGIPGFADGTGAGASFFMPSGLAVRRDPFGSISWSGGNNGYGTIFVSDQGNNTIRVITNNGQVGTYIGSPGQAGSANGSRTSARLFKPTGLAFDGDGNLYIADTGNHTIRRVNTTGTVTTYAGIPGVSGLMDGAASQSLFNEPEGLAFDANKNLYVTDGGNGVIRKITPGGIVSTLLIVGNVPVINTQPASQTINAGSNVTFSVTASGEGTLTYQWRKDGLPISGATSASYTLSAATTSAAGNYTVLVTNSWGSTESASATLTVNTTPSNPGNPGGGGGSGGGSSGGGGGGAPSAWFMLILAALVMFRIRRRG